jgi:hypothetical protein
MTPDLSASVAQRQCGGFAPSPHSECQIRTHCNPVFAGVPLVWTLARAVIAATVANLRTEAALEREEYFSVRASVTLS